MSHNAVRSEKPRIHREQSSTMHRVWVISRASVLNSHSIIGNKKKMLSFRVNRRQISKFGIFFSKFDIKL